ncbi:hypothetical protein CTAYLR_010716 [Chrysophaeum taylorii]|uniref:Uncharacterized protein n=1 Tax=Chrysophaeum taylorii TaxID=2483200 RepID=A0AAD7U5G6_9STRA|nr:hypothetical protein CTAYLR_010716 [Chrysophaeum taylorii]
MDSQFDAPDGSTDGYEFVSSMNMIAVKDTSFLKGDEFGYFMFGGSAIIVLFQAEAKANIDANTDVYQLYGTQMGTCSPDA